MNICLCAVRVLCAYTRSINENEQQKYKYVNDKKFGSYPPYLIPSCLLFVIGDEGEGWSGWNETTRVGRNRKKNRSIMELRSSCCMKRNQPSPFAIPSEISTLHIHTHTKHIGILWLWHRYFVPCHKTQYIHICHRNECRIRMNPFNFFFVNISVYGRNESARKLWMAHGEKHTRLSLLYFAHPSFL